MNAIKSLGAIALFAGAVSANAAYDFNSGKPYVGVKAGQVSFVDRWNNRIDNWGYGVYGGYEFNGNAGLELEYQRTAPKNLGSNAELIENGTISARSDISIDSYGLYGSYRYQLESLPIYLKGRLGITKNTGTATDSITVVETTETKDGANIKNQTTNKQSWVLEQTGLAGGIGVGYQVSPSVSVEIGYNRLPNPQIKANQLPKNQNTQADNNQTNNNQANSNQTTNNQTNTSQETYILRNLDALTLGATFVF